MEYAIQFADQQQWGKIELAEINQIRIYKQTILPCELVRMNSSNSIECFYNINKRSILKWKFEWLIIPKS